MTFTGVTTSCNISIWCQPAVGNTSNGYRARVALTIQASTPAPTSITTNYATTSSPTTSVTVTSNGGSVNVCKHEQIFIIVFLQI